MNKDGQEALGTIAAGLSLVALVLHPEGVAEMLQAAEDELAWQVEIIDTARRNEMLRETINCLWGNQ